MRRVRFLDEAGSIRTGAWTDKGIEGAKRTYPVEEVDLLAPVTPSKIIGVGRNYRGRFSSSDEYPEQPRIWWKGGPNVVASPGAEIPIPADGEMVYGAELGVVVAKECSGVAEDEVDEYIAGYTCVNDLSDHSYPSDPLMLRKKSFDNSAPIGPVVSSKSLVPDNPRVQLWVNGSKQQDSDGHEFIYTVPEVISTISQFVTLQPDDVVMMGNPGDHDVLQEGDTVEIQIQGIGRLTHSVVGDSGPSPE